MKEERLIYLDNNATTKVDELVYLKMERFLRESYGNASAAYSFGRQSRDALQEARQHVAFLLGAKEQEIVFTSCGSESNNAVISSAVATEASRKKIITSSVEHMAVLEPIRHLKKNGYEVIELRVDTDGNLDRDQYLSEIDDNTALVSVMWANNENGVIFPVEELARSAKAKGALFHTDAVQALGKIPIDLSRNPAIDFVSFSGHKLHAPKGVGGLYIKEGTPFEPFIRGGHQERNLRAGTENVASIVALGEACRLAQEHIEEDTPRIRYLRNKLQKGLTEKIAFSRVNGEVDNRLANTLSIAFRNIVDEGILQALSRAGICASSGSACTSGSLDPSHVMKAMGLPPEYITGVFRFSLSRLTTEAEIDEIISVLPPLIEEQRSFSIFEESG